MNLANGQFAVSECTPELLDTELHRVAPAELICPEGQNLSLNDGTPVRHLPDWHFEKDSARNTLLNHFGTDSLAGFDLADTSPCVGAAGALLYYVRQTQSQALHHIQGIRVDRPGQYVVLDPVTSKNLEITVTLSGEASPTLFSTLDHCQTPMGSRLLRHWLHHPLRDNAPVLERQGIIRCLLLPAAAPDAFSANPLFTLRQLLRNFPDIERMATRIALRSVRPRELASLRDALHLLPELADLLLGAFTTDAALAQHALSKRAFPDRARSTPTPASSRPAPIP